VRFGVFEANFASQELRKHGTSIRLRGQAFALLRLLVQKDGEIVTRVEMKNALWPADTFVDFENGLNAAVKKLRSALGDSPENPRYIETIPKIGYRFVAPVREKQRDVDNDGASARTAAPVPVNIEEIATAEPAVSKNQVSKGLLTLAAISAVVATAAWLATRTPAAARVTRGVVMTSTARVDGYGRLQTDGTRLFFLERHGHRWMLMQMPASGGEVQPFANPFESTRLLAVSPNSSEMLIAPFVQRGEPLALWIMTSVGGAPRRLGTVVASDAVFTADGASITYATNDGIFIVGRDGLKAKPIVEMKGEKSSLGWSPDGKVLRFEVLNPEGTTSNIWEIRTDGSGLRQLVPGWEQHPSQC